MKHILKGLKILAIVSLNGFILGVVITFVWGDYDPSGRSITGPAWLKYPLQFSLWGLGISVGSLCFYGLNKVFIELLFKSSPPAHENKVLPDHE